jgi:hypothetical protein
LYLFDTKARTTVPGTTNISEAGEPGERSKISEIEIYQNKW